MPETATAAPAATTPADPSGGAGTPTSEVIKPPVELENRTARRIGIRLRGREEYLVIPPFGRREVEPAAQAELELEPWISAGLVAKIEPNDDTSGGAAAGFAIWGILVSLAFALARPEAAAKPTFWLPAAAVNVALLVVAWNGLTRTGEALRGFVQRAYRWFGILLLSLVGFGLPALTVEMQRRSMEPAQPFPPLVLLYLGVCIAFVGIFSTLPALLYYLFDQQHKHSVRTEFFRDVMRLSPPLQTMMDAEATYRPRLDEVYGERKQGMLFNLSALPILVSTLLLTLGWIAALLPTLAELPADPSTFVELLVPKRTTFTFAFLGAYFFTLNMAFRRYVRADLGPKAYSHISMRIIIAIVLAWVASEIPQLAGTPGEETAWLLLIAVFFIGVVPETGMALYHDILVSQQRWLGIFLPSVRERDPLSNLQGITLYDRARLLEEGIENIENLAHHDIVELMLRTRIPTPRLVDLVDQAILYLHARDADADPESGAILGRLRALGIRTATDLEVSAAAAEEAGLGEAFNDVLGRTGETPRLFLIRKAMEDDEWMSHLRHWRGYLATYDKLYCYGSFLPAEVVDDPARR